MKKQYITLAAAICIGATLSLSSCAEGNNGDMPPESTSGDTQITGPEDDMTDTLDASGSTGATTAGTTTTGSTTGTTDGTTTGTTGSTTGGTTGGTTGR